jgi:hypothetical protein
MSVQVPEAGVVPSTELTEDVAAGTGLAWLPGYARFDVAGDVFMAERATTTVDAG